MIHRPRVLREGALDRDLLVFHRKQNVVEIKNHRHYVVGGRCLGVLSLAQEPEVKEWGYESYGGVSTDGPCGVSEAIYKV